MSVEAVFDTNVLLYAASKDKAVRDKSRIAIELLSSVEFGLPLQVLQEFFHNARVKARLAIDEVHCEKMLKALLNHPVVVTDIELFEAARRLARGHKLRYWDAAIVAATRRLGASLLYSEGLNDGQVYDGVKVVNPFRAKSVPH
jgi:predicted nucleic acid-binding protein